VAFADFFMAHTCVYDVRESMCIKNSMFLNEEDNDFTKFPQFNKT